MSTLDDNTTLVRRMDVTARMTGQVAELSERTEGGVLLETWVGRYVIDSEGRVVWLLIDGQRNLGQVVDGVAERLGLSTDEVRRPVYDLCERLLELGLVEEPTAADSVALAQPAVAG
ncbi:PqqD family protein [Streptomyces griseoluteus]|uniref:PqqD family protein n=1 Tax=Streptomyces griseoluteus TaxID=29306 RepID=UPI00370240AD